MGTPHWVRFSSLGSREPKDIFSRNLFDLLASHLIVPQFITGIKRDEDGDLSTKCWEEREYRDELQITQILHTHLGLSLSFRSTVFHRSFSIKIWKESNTFMCLDLDREIFYEPRQEHPGEWLAWLLVLLCQHFDLECAGYGASEEFTTETFAPLILGGQIQRLLSGVLNLAPAPRLYVFRRDALMPYAVDVDQVRALWTDGFFRYEKDYLVLT